MKRGPKLKAGHRRGVTGRLIYQTPCVCGSMKSRGTALCVTCYKKAPRRRRRPPPEVRLCETCGREFQRDRTRPDDVLRFCSRMCGYRARTAAAASAAALSAAARLEARRDQDIERAIARVLKHELRVRLKFPPSAQRRARRAGSAHHPRVDHVCPNCGHQFLAVNRAVYCTVKCGRQYRKKHRYPIISAIPIERRNTLAELIALERAANRAIHGPQR